MNSVTAGEPVDLEAGEELQIVDSVKEGDKIEFLADFYDYKGNFLDSVDRFLEFMELYEITSRKIQKLSM